MTIARTQIAPTLHPAIVEVGGQRMEGMLVTFDDFSVTDSGDTTAVVYLGGLIPWRLINESGGAVTFTLRSARTKDGTALIPYDQDHNPVLTVTVVDDGDEELPDGLHGIIDLVIIGSAAADGITLVCKR